MPHRQTSAPNPRRVAAGKKNRLKRNGLTSAGRETLRQNAIQNRPWIHSTGPRTAVGKARSAANGKKRQKGLYSVRELRAVVADVRDLMKQARLCRSAVAQIRMSQMTTTKEFP